MTVKAVIHVDSEDSKVLALALGNIRNLLDQIPDEPSDVRMIVNHYAVNFFKKEDAGKYADIIAGLAGKGVRFLICNNSIQRLGIDRTALLEPCEVVPAGIVELVRLQSQGFAYVKP